MPIPETMPLIAGLTFGRWMLVSIGFGMLIAALRLSPFGKACCERRFLNGFDEEPTIGTKEA